MFSPNSRTSPLRGRTKPTMALMQVVLPAPLRPSNARTFPEETENETPWRTWLSPYKASTPSRHSASVAKVDLLGPRVTDHLGAGALDDHAPVMQHGDALRQVERRVHVVLD